MRQARGRQQLGQRVQRVAMEVGHALRLVGHDQRALAQRILRGDASGAFAGVAGLGLDAADGNMKPRAELHQSAPIAITRAMSKAVMICPTRPA